MAVLSLSSAAIAQSKLDPLLEQARNEEKTGDYTAAERTYQRALTLVPPDPETLKRLGVLQQTELKFDDSIQSLQQVLASNPKYAQVNFFLGVSYLGKNDPSDAIVSFHRELENIKPHPRCHYYLALALQAAGRMEEAVSELNQSVADDPKDADALYQLVRIYKNASFQAMDKLKAVDPDSFQVHSLMGEAYAEEQRYPEAIKEYQSALAKRPDAPGIHYEIGIAYWSQNQLDFADKEFTEALKENSADAMTNLYLGDIALRRRHYGDAFRFLQASERSAPEMAQVHLLLGKCFQGQEDFERAKAEFLKAIAADPAAAQPHYLLAQVYRKLNQPEASTGELARFQELSKKSERVP